MSKLEPTLREIEELIDSGSYRPGPWSAFLEAARAKPREERLALSHDVTRISDKLHGLQGHPAMPVETALAIEVLATLVGLTLLALGIRAQSAGSVIVATAVLAVTLQPLLKTGVGQLLGIRYSYAYLWKFEPRFKMRYGTYLSAKRWERVAVHASGCFGTPLALWIVAALSTGRLDWVAQACALLFSIALAGQVALFVLTFAGFERLGRLGPLRLTSAGGAAYELQQSTP